MRGRSFAAGTILAALALTLSTACGGPTPGDAGRDAAPDTPIDAPPVCTPSCGVGSVCVNGACVGLDSGFDARPDALPDVGADVLFDDAQDVRDMLDAATADTSDDATDAGTVDAGTGDAATDTNDAGCAPLAECSGACVDFATDIHHCGACNNDCPAPANGVATCSASACGIACNAGFHDCGGACVQNASVSACGAACTVCVAPANAVPTCDGTACGFVCATGFHDCSGFCVSNADVNTCGGACGPCTAPLNGTATCDGTACGFVCDPGYTPAGGQCVAAPRPIAPLSGAVVTSRRPTLRWLNQGQPDATVMLCRDRACTVQLSAPQHVVGASYVPPVNLPVGTMYWKVNGGTSTNDATPTWEFHVGARNAAVDATAGNFLDANGDGYSDFVVGAQDAGPTNSLTGAIYVYYGAPSGVAGAPTTISGQTNGATGFGTTVLNAGDVNGDGFGDVVVWLPRALNNVAQLNVFFGGPGGLSTTPSQVIENPSGIADAFGTPMASPGDVNGDGYSDIVVVALGNNGAAYVFLGGRNGLNTIPARTIAGPDNVASVGGGDFDGDGYGDVAVSGWREGRVRVFFGGPTGIGASPAGTIATPDPMAHFGISLNMSGDLNGDGRCDLVMGADNANNNFGQAYVTFGAAVVPSGVDVTLNGTLQNAYYGGTLEAVGDVDGDGYGDLAVAAYAGNRFVLYRGGSAGPSSATGQVYTAPSPGGSYFAIGLVAGDYNNDGVADLVSTEFHGPAGGVGRTHLFLGTSPGGPPSVPDVILTNPTGLGDGYGGTLALRELTWPRMCSHPKG